MSAHWAGDYVGLPWANGAQGPRAFDCWGLVREVQKTHLRRDLPLIAVDADNWAAVAATFATSPERGRWTEVEKPEEGDIVFFHKNASIDHVGVWVAANGGSVLHSMRGVGVVCMRLIVARKLGWTKVTFNRFCAEH